AAADRGIAIDGDPLLVGLLTQAGVGREHVVRMAGVRGDPVTHAGDATWTHGDRDSLIGHKVVWLVPRLVLLVPAFVVIELVRQDGLVVVAVRVERTDRVGVVSPPFVARDVPHHGPRDASVPGFVEAEQVVVALGSGEPLARTDDVVRIGGVDADIGLRLIGHEHWARGRCGTELRRVLLASDVFAGGRAWTRQLARVSVVRPVVEGDRHLGPVTAHLP